MKSYDLNFKQYSDLINLTNKVFYPLKTFINKNQFNSILKKKKFGNKFFTFPIYLGFTKEDYLKLKNEKKLTLRYNNKDITYVSNINFFKINHNLFGKTIYGNSYLNHPYFKIFQSENYMFLSFIIKKKFLKLICQILL